MQSGRKPEPANCAEAGIALEPPEPPDIVLNDPIAKREWDEICASMVAMEIICPADKALITAYCIAWSEYVRCQERLAEKDAVKKDSLIVKSMSGAPTYNPYWAIRKSAIKEIRALAGDLGIGAIARARLKLGAVEE